MFRSRELAALLVLPIMVSGSGVSTASAAAVDFSYKSAPQLRVLEVEREPLADLKLLIEPKSAELAATEPSILKRLFKALAGAVAPSEALAQSVAQTPGQPSAQNPAQTQPTIGFTKGKGLVAQDSDPNFKLWQKMADERLKGEQALREVKPHRLALLHPDQYVVVCEAGCRKAPEEIVYKVAIAKARAPITRLEPTAAAEQVAAAPIPAAGPSPAPTAAPSAADGAPEQAPDTILCVAGCYERANVHQARKKVADAGPAKVPVQKAALHSGARNSSDYARSRLATVEPNASSARRMARHSVQALRVSPPGKWQMRIVYEVSNKAMTAKRSASAKQLPAKAGVWRTKVTPVHPSEWRTKITFSPAAKDLAQSRAQLKQLAHVQQLRQALHPIRSARATHFRVSETRY